MPSQKVDVAEFRFRRFRDLNLEIVFFEIVGRGVEPEAELAEIDPRDSLQLSRKLLIVPFGPLSGLR
jgi:hypothetical protein